MPKYRVRVHEQFVTEYLIDADTEESALEEAERRNIADPSGHGAEQSSCDRSCEVVSVES